MDRIPLPTSQPLKLDYEALPDRPLPIGWIIGCIGGWLIVGFGFVCALGGVVTLWTDGGVESSLLIISLPFILLGLGAADRALAGWRNAAPRSAVRAESLMIYFLAGGIFLFGVLLFAAGVMLIHDHDWRAFSWLLLPAGILWMVLGVLSVRAAWRKWRLSWQVM